MEKKEKKERKEVPFFARFLEKQEFPRVKSEVKAGRWYVTMKWPSDDDEWPTM